MADDETNAKKGGFSFGFAKKIDNKKLQTSVVSDSEKKKEEETDFVYSFEGKEVKSSKPTDTAPKQFVIPLIKSNNWRTPFLEKKDQLKEESDKTNSVDSKDDTEPKVVKEDLTLTEQATREIIEASALENQNWTGRGQPDPNLSVPLLVRNKVPEGFETDDKLDVSLRPDGPEDADYEQIPIDQFGFAMLRGMGWKDGEGIGKNKELVPPPEAILRPKGLGLGADRSTNLQMKNGAVSEKGHDKEDELELKKGAFCLITKGTSRDMYGVIEGLDDDNARIMVKLTLSGKIVTISQYSVELVSKKDYEKFSKYLNKGKVDKYKKEEEKKKKDKHRSRSRSPHEKSRRKKSHRGHSRSPHDDRKHADHKDKKAKQENGYNANDVYLWARPDIRVRIVDKKFKSGKYYKSKVIVVDVVSVDNCVCRTEEGRVLEGLSQSSLETVIPKHDHAHALIVSGKYKGQIGEVVKRSKEKCEALLQLLSDRDIILKLGYDDICEYVGDIDQQFDY
ncbi:LOW QUALITY PROTEIN: G-patch domain and KOW motifs-containing protein-like [Haliotis rubra]|uniref:LOW QUALITY PROTEIN: G-patch domain and KOW motifs-containing protein-like n=1 Tax=Haliotis rubra TaxID=36100 RepID=UPI001EE4FD34|nr:LOW QUALITY PROTEIN: G-patch domain and KOW motifs-containing protein-like [Haliotis rubra]